MAGTACSAMRKVFALVVAPDAWELINILNTVADVAVAATEATGDNLMVVIKLPLEPAVNALKMSVAMVPVPSDFVFAALPTWTPLIFGVRGKIGVVFAGILHPYIVNEFIVVEKTAF